MIKHGKKIVDPRERAVRALCKNAGNLENITFEGKPMWMSYLDDVNAVLDAANAIPIASKEEHFILVNALESAKIDSEILTMLREWFRDAVNTGLEDDRPTISHDQVMTEAQSKIDQNDKVTEREKNALAIILNKTRKVRSKSGNMHSIHEVNADTENFLKGRPTIIEGSERERFTKLGWMLADYIAENS